MVCNLFQDKRTHVQQVRQFKSAESARVHQNRFARIHPTNTKSIHYRAVKCKIRMGVHVSFGYFHYFSVSTAHFWNEISFFFSFLFSFCYEIGQSHTGMRFQNEKGMRLFFNFKYCAIIHIELRIELNKLTAHFIVQIKNDKINIIYSIIKE